MKTYKCPKCGRRTPVGKQFCQNRKCLFNVGLYYNPVNFVIGSSTRSAEERKLDDYSPEEVMAGVPHGGSIKGSGFHGESKEDWGKEHKRGVKELKEVLS